MTEEDKDKGRNLPWIFRKGTAAVDGRGVDWDPSSALYRLFDNTRNPYLKRALAPPAPRAAPGEGELQKLFRLLEEERIYRVAPPNAQGPYRRRKLDHGIPPAAHGTAKFQDPSALPGDPARLPALIGAFFRSVLDRIREDPSRFFDVIDEMTELFQRNGIRVRVAEAFRAFEDWDDLLDTLEEIARYPAPETFDLFCGALLAYHELVEPERS
jgi:hypothetical protein